MVRAPAAGRHPLRPVAADRWRSLSTNATFNVLDKIESRANSERSSAEMVVVWGLTSPVHRPVAGAIARGD